MFQSIWDEVKREFQYGNMVSRIVIANVVIFIVITIAKLFLNIPGSVSHFDDFLHFFAISGNPRIVLTHPWTLISAAFTHESFWHLFWNMLAFFWFGRIVGDLLGNHRVLPLYILGAIVGNIVFLIAANFSPYTTGFYALGASAAVMSMIGCAAFIAPDYIFNIILIGPVKLKFVALAIILLDVAGVANNFNAGGSFAHLGGAALGMYYGWSLQVKGFDWAKPVNKLIAFFQSFFTSFTFSFPKRTKKISLKDFEKQRVDPIILSKVKSVNREYEDSKNKQKNKNKPLTEQERLDKILEKIKVSNYESLSLDEKTFLEQMSKKN